MLLLYVFVDIGCNSFEDIVGHARRLMPNCLDFGPDISLLQDPALSHRVVKVFWVSEFFFLVMGE